MSSLDTYAAIDDLPFHSQLRVAAEIVETLAHRRDVAPANRNHYSVTATGLRTAATEFELADRQAAERKAAITDLARDIAGEFHQSDSDVAQATALYDLGWRKL